MSQKTTQSQVEKMKEKLPAKYQAVVNDLFRDVSDVDVDSHGVTVHGYLADKTMFTNRYPDKQPYHISYLRLSNKDKPYAAITFHPGVEI